MAHGWGIRKYEEGRDRGPLLYSSIFLEKLNDPLETQVKSTRLWAENGTQYFLGAKL